MTYMRRFFATISLCVTIVLCTACGVAPHDTTGQHPQRIVSMSITIDHMLVDIVDFHHIAALSELADDENLSFVVEKAKKVKGRTRNYTTEEILSFGPDLVLVDSSWKPDAVRNLRDAGVRVEIIEVAKSIEEIPKSLEAFGKAVGEEEKAQAVIASFKKELAALKEEVPVHKKRIYTFWGIYSYGGYDSFLGDLYRKTDVDNVLGDKSQKEVLQLSPEYILKVPPDIIVTASLTTENAKKNGLDGDVLSLPQLQILKAVQEGAIVSLQGKYIYCPHQYAPSALRMIREKIYGN